MEVYSDSFDIPEHLLCPICFELPENKVFQCKDGHILCGDCYSQLASCPQCRTPFGTTSIRNRVLEGMVERHRENKNKTSGRTTVAQPVFSHAFQKRREILLPGTVVEAILSRLPITAILKCNLVCREWKTLISKSSFWEKCYKYHGFGLDWNAVPAHIRNKDKGWMVLYSQFRNKIFTKNYISNPSGKNGLQAWNVTQNEGDGWGVEKEPVYCQPMPMPSPGLFLDVTDNHCFVTSYGWCSKNCVIDLWAAGFNPKIMTICLPFEIRCFQMYTARGDCGGEFKWELQILNPHKQVVHCQKSEMERRQNTNWEIAEFSFRFTESDAQFLDQVRYLVFIHEGKDNKVWAGRYGMKFARASVTVKPDNPAATASIFQGFAGKLKPRIR